jgi:hypothetical protein
MLSQITKRNQAYQRNTVIITNNKQMQKMEDQPCKNGTETSPPPTLRTLSFRSIIHCMNRLKLKQIHPDKLSTVKGPNSHQIEEKVLVLPGACEAYQAQRGIPY